MVWLQSAIPLIAGILLLLTTAATTTQRYHFINDYLSWVEAQQFCKVKYTDLATVNNMDDKNELVKTLGGRAVYSWIGLQRAGGRKWVWSDGRGEVHFNRWDEGEPSQNSNNEWCGEISQTGYWNDLPCGEENDFVCYEGHSGGGVARYVHYKDGRNWMNSRDLCRSQHTDLAYVSTEGENSEIANLVKSWTGIIGFNNKAWFGLFNDNWRWSDGAASSFRYWLHSTQNSGHCASVVTSQQGRWIDANCNNKYAFVCEGSLKEKKRIIRVKVRSDADLTAPKITDALLIKFGEAMAHHMVSDFSISLRKGNHGINFHRQLQLEGLKEPGCPL